MIPRILPQRQHKTNAAMPFNDLVSYIEENNGQEKRYAISNKFSNILDYVTTCPDKASDQEKCIAIRTHGIGDITTASIEMNAVAARNTRCKDPAYHFILSWPEHERPDPAAIFDAAEHAIESLGLADHQYVIAVHANTDNIHCHVAVNRINPNTYRSRNIEWAKKSLHMAARRSEIKHAWSHDNGIYLVKIDGHGKKYIVLNKEQADAVARPTPNAHRHLSNETILPAWHDPDSLDAWLKTKVANALKRALPDIQSWHGLHAWLSKHDITLTDAGGGGMRLHADSPKTGEVLDLAASKGLRILKRCELEKRWGNFVNAIPMPCIVPDLSHLTPRQVAIGVEDFLAIAPDGGMPPEHIILAQQHARQDAIDRGSDLPDFHIGSLDVGAQNSGLPLSERMHDRKESLQTAQAHNMRRPGAADAGRRERSLTRDDSKRAEHKAKRAAARADLRQRFSQYKQLVRGGDTKHFKRMNEIRTERSQVLKQVREQRKAAIAEILKRTALPVRLITIFEIDAECIRRKLQAEAIFQDKSRALRATRLPPLSWRAWLFEQANLGDQAALSDLRGIVYQAQRDAKGDKTIDAGDVLAVAGTEEYRAQQYRAVMARLLEEEKKEAAIRSANSNIVRPYEADALLARYTGIRWRVTGNGNVKYSDERGNHLFSDRGNRITFDRECVSDDEIRLALVHAKLKFGNQITLTGDDLAFTARMARLAHNMGMSILIPELRPMPTRSSAVVPSDQSFDLHVSVLKTRGLEQSAASRPKKAKAKRSVAPPVLEIPADDLHLAEIVDKTTPPLTTAEWIAQQEKPAVRPYMHGDPTVEYLVAYVARDGIVLDHGVAVAPYPVPTSLALHAGDKVIVCSNGELRLQHVPEPGEPGQRGTGQER